MHESPALVGVNGTVTDGADASYSAYRAQSMFGSLDGLRALSILAVIWHHAVSEPWIEALVPASKLGFLGVDLFFVLSGFLIVTLLLRERERNAQISLKHFYLRRALRIFPLYYGVLALFTVVYALRQSPAGQRFFQDLPFLLAYLTNWHAAGGIFAITWSLSAEEQFYLIWPPLERFMRSFALPCVLALIALSQLIHFGLIDDLLQHAVGWGPDEPGMLRQTTFTPILLGVLLAHLLHDRARFSRLYALLGHPAAAPTAMLLLLLVPHTFPEDIAGFPRLLTHVLMFVLLGTCVVREDHMLADLFKWRPLARIGALSYGLYLVHMIGIGAAERLLARLGVYFPLSAFVFGFLASLLLAELSFRFYESRFLRLKSRFAS